MKKFITLITAIKILLIGLIVYFIISMISGFRAGWNDVEYAENDNVTRSFSHAKEFVSVKPLKESLLYKNSDYVVTGISMFQIQEMRNTEHSTVYYCIEILKFIIAVTGAIFGIKFFRNSFTILNRFKKLKVFEKTNLPILNKVAVNLLVFTCAVSLFEIISYIGYYKTIKIPGYNMAFDFDNTIDFSGIIIALILLAFSKIMTIAIELKQENELTV